ncbi:MAG TPA: phosphoesterase [Archaeoglobaceae archaeon]|nr:phosphoesterase [Archaeoglobaceae archaeon]
MTSKISEIELTPEKAAVIDRTAVIADLHLGIESMMQDYGVTFPRVQIREIIRDVKRLIEKYNIERLVIAGDLKHEFGRNLPHEWEDIELFLKTFSEIEMEIVRGNHDNFLSAILSRYGIDLKERIQVGEWTVLHGHIKYSEEKIIMGHEHPAIKIRSEGAIYTFPCYLSVNNIVVLPAFSPLVPGSNVLEVDSFLSPILELDAGDVEVYAIEDEIFYLGKIEDIRKTLI